MLSLSGNGDLRLQDGSTYEGRVEIYYDGSWGTVCDDGWTLIDANVVCRQLGLGDAEDTPPFGQGDGEIWLDEVSCSGYESRLDSCSHRGWGVHNCAHNEDAGVRCSIGNPVTNVRLVNGYSTSEGRLEILYNGQWGTVCDDSFDTDEGNVICRQLGYTGVSQIHSNAYFGEGVGPILGSINCYGLSYELEWTDCSIYNWDTGTCSHNEDVGLTCLEATAIPVTNVRLVNGYSTSEGRLEIFYEGQWGTVCDDSFETSDADVICRQLGYTGASNVYSNAYFGEGVGPIMAGIDCYGYTYEQQWTDCNIDDWDTNRCTHSEDVGLTCYGATGSGDVRLINGYTPGEGTVQIYYNNEWGTICDDNFDLQDAHVICRQLGYSGALEYQSSAYYGEGDGPILYDIDCNGWEDSWRDCYFYDWGTSSCSHSEDIGVQCTHDSIGSISVTGIVVTAIIVILIGVCCCSICAAVIKNSRQPRSSATAAGTHQQVPHQTNQMAAMQPLPTSGSPKPTATNCCPIPTATHCCPYPQQPTNAPYPQQLPNAPYPQQPTVVPAQSYPAAVPQGYPPQNNQAELYPQQGNPTVPQNGD
ncbi:putative deleted in malignant brain tumors 1 protein-like [Apostichopus japonicus]|uniref:Putative deleted in malignant brain tumors 1 protein-like n=1 Tax=Stichopus japonicus TaxID=307972 RepID=A0A2G8JSI8_STIJA|nr:putative deleted in malignant brain tumors 1 protein-like [Apostichopus japonicus]